MSFYNLSATLNTGKTLAFEALRGKTVLVVNVASKCGKTKYYTNLEEIYKKYHSKGLEILAFPSNQFGAQEPGSDEEIATFCEKNYGVTFPITKKTDVNGEATNEVYKYLKEKKNVEAISWNFDLFLINKEGEVVGYYDRKSNIADLEAEVEKVL